MRDIKFRAWDKYANKMIFDFAVSQHNKFSGWSTCVYCGLKIGSGGSDDYTLMEYTGVKDKNGNEIYEGDIVLWDGGMTKFCTKKAKGKIEWGKAGMFISLISEGEYMYGDREATAIEFEGPEGPLHWWDNLEIIGNIYENPELMI